MADVPEHIKAQLGAIGQVIFQTAANNLTLMLNNEVSAGKSAMAQYPSLTDVVGGDAEPFDPDVDKTFIIARLEASEPADWVFVAATADARYLANTMLGSDDNGTGPLDELQVSAVSEIFSQFLNAAAPGIGNLIGESNLSFVSPTVVPFSEDSIREQVPQFLALPLITQRCDLTVSGGKTVSLEVWLSEEEGAFLADAAAQQVNTAPAADDNSNNISISDEDIAAALAGMNAAAAPTTATPVTVQPVQFASFDNQPDVNGESNRNLDLLLDVKMSLSVRLGDAELPLKHVLELTRGSVVELNRLAGEAVDLYANGKLIARGEVVVIEDNFGLRITSIVSPAERLRELAG